MKLLHIFILAGVAVAAPNPVPIPEEGLTFTSPNPVFVVSQSLRTLRTKSLTKTGTLRDRET